ncbi:protein SDA1 homolog [Oscarella lobularis]|uniref:protein SDA1 homolog n=1 Tax=Oscarella lobularis TaxID=121494 RepID=UPI003313FA80
MPLRPSGNQLPTNLPQLQNLIKRDRESYEEEFLQQYRHYAAQLEVFLLKPTDYSRSFCDLVTFLSQVAHCYPRHLENFPRELIDLLRKHATILDHELRMTVCRALILLRNKNLIPPIRVLELSFELFRCQDKLLRKTLFHHIVADIKNINSKHKDNRLNTQLQNFMYTMLNDSSTVAAKKSLDVIIELYRRNVWNDAKTVNVVATACLSPTTKVLVAAINFFLGRDDDDDEKNDSDDSDDDFDEKQAVKEVMLRGQVSKKTKKRTRKMEKALESLKKHKKKKKRVEQFNFSALHLIYDPQEFAEKLFHKLEKCKERFEVKLMHLNLISRLIGIHKLFLFNYYPHLQRFLNPHQREVTKLLTYLAQSCHDLVPPDVITPTLMTVANHFVSERNADEVMVVGLNAIREVCARAPLVMNEDLLQDLTQYKSYRNKDVRMAARSLIQLFRQMDRSMLHRKDRGKPSEASKNRKIPSYGEVSAPSFVPGTELISPEDFGTGEETGEKDPASDDDEWVDVASSDDEAEDEEDDDSESYEQRDGEDDDEEQNAKKAISSEKQRSNIADAEIVSQTRVLSQADFKLIRKRQLQSELAPSTSRKKAKTMISIDSDEEDGKNREILRPSAIEGGIRKRKLDKEARKACVLAGREDRHKYGSRQKANEFASTSNKTKEKKKNFMMVKQKTGLRRKTQRSLRDKQIASSKAKKKNQRKKGRK